MKNALIAIVLLLALPCCTYAPRNTNIDNTYNARQMAVGVGDQPKDSMTSTTVEEDVPSTNEHTIHPSQNNQAGMSAARLEELNKLRKNRIQNEESSRTNLEQTESLEKYLTIGSTKAEVARIQGTPTEIRKVEWPFYTEEYWSYGLSEIKFANGRINEWRNIDGNLKIKMQ